MQADVSRVSKAEIVLVANWVHAVVEESNIRTRGYDKLMEEDHLAQKWMRGVTA
jgi:hypothetical protein